MRSPCGASSPGCFYDGGTGILHFVASNIAANPAHATVDLGTWRNLGRV